MKTIIRNFLSVLKRFRLATVLNIAGLTVAFAAFMVILMQVKYEHSYDRNYSTANRIYRVDKTVESIFGIVQTRPFIEEFVKSSPHIEAGGLMLALPVSNYFYVENVGEKKGFREAVSIIQPDIVKVFDFPILQGDPECLNDPEKMMIPESLARKIFGEESPIGKPVQTDEEVFYKYEKAFTVGAVYKDFPSNSQLKNCVYLSIHKDLDLNNHYGNNFFCYVLLDKPGSVAAVESNFNSYYSFSGKSIGVSDPENVKVKLFPVTDIYYNNIEVADWVAKTGNRETSIILIAIALFVIIIAAINFTNFSTSLAPQRIKSINTQKVLGSSDGMLRASLLIEAVVISIVSCLLAFLLVYILNQRAVFTFVDADLSLFANIPIVIFTLILSLVVGLIAGVYPAWYITSFPPALVLKGNFGLTPKGKQLRTMLIGFQFVVSIVLIIVTSFVYLQRNFIHNYTSGFDRDQIAIVELNQDIRYNHAESYANGLKAYPGIEEVAFASDVIGVKDMYYMASFKHLGEEENYFFVSVSPEFFNVMGIPIVEGTSPRVITQDSKYVVTRSMADRYSLSPGWYDMHVNDNQKREITGICEDINITSLRQSGHNLVFLFDTDDYQPYSYIRIKAGTDYTGAVDHIRATMKNIDPAYPVDIKFYDEYFNELYRKEENLNKTISLFSLMAILISLVGVFGLVLFETQYRKKEIGIRKVMGAGVEDILIMFNKTYFHIVTICFLIGAPIAWYSVARWLESFAAKTPMYIWVFGIAFIIVAFVVMVTVTLQNWKAATENPVDSIKAE